MAQFLDPERRDFWAICEDRYGVRSTVLRSQLPVSPWHEQIGDPTLADAFSIAGFCALGFRRFLRRNRHFLDRISDATDSILYWTAISNPMRKSLKLMCAAHR
jgi:hypothetical protein